MQLPDRTQGPATCIGDIGGDGGGTTYGGGGARGGGARGAQLYAQLGSTANRAQAQLR